MHYALNIHDHDYGSPLNPIHCQNLAEILDMLDDWREAAIDTVAEAMEASAEEARDEWENTIDVLRLYWAKGQGAPREYAVIDGYRIAIRTHEDGDTCDCEDY